LGGARAPVRFWRYASRIYNTTVTSFAWYPQARLPRQAFFGCNNGLKQQILLVQSLKSIMGAIDIFLEIASNARSPQFFIG
jgi:hypothetical protein